ncbi:sensor histidine kinase [Nocardia sp. NBC_00511]|uniref:sensor histidine kinase n=1 Tax=Nocardia sp. NBC_00511 TaxID=2903591 RepID=UPI0030DF2AB8
MAVPLASLAVAVIAVVGAVVFAPDDARLPLAIGAGVAGLLWCAAVTVAVFYRAQLAGIRAEAQTSAARADAQVHATVAAAQARIVEAEAHAQGVRDAVAEQSRAAKDSDHRRAAAMAAFAGAAGRMQAMSTSMLAELREMENRHADPKVLADLLELDHRTAQAGRLADSIAVLSGARSGRRWAKPIAMESILRGAMGRVAGYQRVRLRAVTEIAIAGHAAEGIMHALAELLDNACNFSPPTTEVHVYAAEVPAGVVVTIEDSGLVMSESALRRAESAVSRPRGNSDLSSLSGTRLGLAVVGHLARKHELTVSYRPSAIGGTAVVVVVPRELTTRLERQGTLSRLGTVASGEGPNTGPLPIQQPAAVVEEIAETVTTAPGSGLPRRQRGSTFAAVHPDGLDATTPPAAPRPPVSPSAMGAFQRAVTGRETPAEAAPLTTLGAVPGESARTADPFPSSAQEALQHTRHGNLSPETASLLPASVLEALQRGVADRDHGAGTVPTPTAPLETDR